MPTSSARRAQAWPLVMIASLALALLGMTLAWHIPLMLWDHLDLVPLLPGAAAGSPWRWLDVHGGHWHAAAYPLLLATTALSDGQPWLDCAVSWLLLIGFAGLIDRIASASAAGCSERPWLWLLLMALALFPGHLPNLQWGWQVAVFLCLFGSAATIRLLTMSTLHGGHNALALLAALLALLSFATALALLPVALLAVALRREQSSARRLGLALPWLVFGGLVTAHYVGNGLTSGGRALEPLAGLLYLLNFLGAGIARFWPELAPWLATTALLLAIRPAQAALAERSRHGWLLLIAFALAAGALTALGRAADFGPEQAFVSRYVSFSSLFWIGWAGLLAPASGQRHWQRWLLIGLGLFALANAVHLIKRSARVADETRTTAALIRSQWPDVSPELLGRAYFDQPEIARQRFGMLQALGYPPFAERAPQ